VTIEFTFITPVLQQASAVRCHTWRRRKVITRRLLLALNSCKLQTQYLWPVYITLASFICSLPLKTDVIGSRQLLSEIFLILRRIQRDTINIHRTWSAFTVPVILRKIVKYLEFPKHPSSGSRVFPCGRT
jgi:hypothetical protein